MYKWHCIPFLGLHPIIIVLLLLGLCNDQYAYVINMRMLVDFYGF
jgi:hypothetical protein